MKEICTDMQHHMDTGADISVACAPADERYVLNVWFCFSLFYLIYLCWGMQITLIFFICLLGIVLSSEF